jgi:phi13 family phage major tail protein
MATSSRIGLRDVVIGWLDDDTDTSAVAATYTLEATSTLEAIDAQISRGTADPNVQYADDIESDVLYPDPEITISLEVKEVPIELQKLLMGQATAVDANGAYKYLSGSTPPYFALGFKSKKRSGADRYVWYYKCRVKPLDETFHTKEKDITRQQDKLEITAIKRTYDKYVSVKVDSDAAGAPNAATFFGTVYEAATLP